MTAIVCIFSYMNKIAKKINNLFTLSFLRNISDVRYLTNVGKSVLQQISIRNDEKLIM